MTQRKDTNLELVTIIVVAYNSSSTIIETLDSIKNQSYSPKELIISDDCSIDNTVKLCEEWTERNKSSFESIEIVTSPMNTGVAGNLNRARHFIHGQYVKSIAGDDILLPTCISDNVDYLSNHPSADVVVSKSQTFYTVNEEKILGDILPDQTGEKILESSTGAQLRWLYYTNYIPAPSVFFRSTIINEYAYDERYPMFEDKPYFLKLLKNDIHLNYLPKVTVLYRRGESLSYSSKQFKNEVLLINNRKWFYEEAAQTMKNDYPDIYRRYRIVDLIEDIQVLVFNNKKTLVTRFLNKLLLLFFRKELRIDVKKLQAPPFESVSATKK